MNIRKEDMDKWDKLDKGLDKIIKNSPRIISGDLIRKSQDLIKKGAASSAVEPAEDGKDMKSGKAVEKLLKELFVKSPTLFKLIVRKIAKDSSDSVGFTDSNTERKKPTEYKPEIDEEKAEETEDSRMPQTDKESAEVDETVPTEEVETEAGDVPVDDVNQNEEVRNGQDSPELKPSGDDSVPGFEIERDNDPEPRPEYENNNPTDEDPQVNQDNINQPNINEQQTPEVTNEPVSKPTDPVDAQANNQDTVDRMVRIEDELQSAKQILGELRQVASEQGLLTEEEIEEVVNPLLDETSSLLNNLKQFEEGRERQQSYPGPERKVGTAERNLDYSVPVGTNKNYGTKGNIRKEMTPEERARHAANVRWGNSQSRSGDSDESSEGSKKPGIVDRVKDWWNQEGSKPKPMDTSESRKIDPYGSKIAERKASSFDSSEDRKNFMDAYHDELQGRMKYVYKPGKDMTPWTSTSGFWSDVAIRYDQIKQRSKKVTKAKGWHGDSEGHAEAARERWEGEGSGSESGIKGEAKKGVKRAARKAGKVVSNAIGETVADIGLDVLGTVAGIVAWRYMAGKSINIKSLGALGVASSKRGIRHLLNTKRGKQLKTMLQNKEMAQKLKRTARSAGSVASISGAATAAGSATAEAVGRSKRKK